MVYVTIPNLPAIYIASYYFLPPNKAGKQLRKVKVHSKILEGHFLLLDFIYILSFQNDLKTN